MNGVVFSFKPIERTLIISDGSALPRKFYVYVSNSNLFGLYTFLSLQYENTHDFYVV